MADESQWCCPICYGHQEGIASLSPCRHQFCLGCAMRWAEQNHSCPLCRTEATAIRFSQRSDDDFLTFSWSESTEPLGEDYEEEQAAEEPTPSPLVGGFPPEVWADFFRSHPFNIRPLLPWLRREIEVIFQESWFMARALEGTVVARLCKHGLDQERLLETLRYCVPGNPETFVRQLIATASQVCGCELQHRLAQQNPAASSSPRRGSERSSNTTSSSHTNPSATASYGASSSPPASQRVTPESILASSRSLANSDVEEPRVVIPGPPAQGCSHSPSTPSQGRDRSPRGPRRPPKRRAPRTQDSAQPHKRPCHQQP